ncbi:substrate-binding domain-containing protein [Nostoc sp. UCD121]|uniref:substrate-binding domain-containing protein n=1 Tax=unclassified Nostoc TaxID=2593658 RepID=UPI0016284174|nr:MULTISPECIES: substrate-binding domain-containing protein [unclassified Nostoc]MBC1219776.1 substrate-binding domain-containing protein [Nostoc sp. UCD120]MBC1276276.1 substrate-binding domain-containing protein [Nostoc sp. UCD121]MBC1295889.1 substrate-binding domain-containing protein [Nostoc sp. UCD122]
MKKIAESMIIGVILLGLCSCNSVKTTELKDSNPVTSQTDAQGPKLIKIGSSSSTVTVLKLLAKGYESQNKTVKIEFISNSQSEGAIAALNNNIIDIAGSSKQLKPEENNGKIEYRELAQDLLIVANHKSVKGVKNLSTKQLKAIYKGDITNWRELGGADANIVVLDRPEDESAKKLLRKYYLGGDKTTNKAVILNKEGELIETLQSTPNSIGAFSLAYSLINQLPVNHLSLNGVAPKSQNFSSGQYKMVRHIGILWNKAPSAATQNFIDFIFSKEGEQLLQNNGFVPAK